MGQGDAGIFEGRSAWLVVVAAVTLVLLVNPVGYAGGGRDDTRYLFAAMCWVEQGGVCRPTDHWTTRWPAIAPLAAAVGLGGATRTAVSLGTFPAYLIAVLLVGWLGRLWFSRAAGIVGAALFAVAPAVSLMALRPNVDMVELATQLAALGLGTLAIRGRSPGMALAAGVCAGLAVAARDTSFLFAGLGAAFWWLLAPEARNRLWVAVSGFLLVIGTEMLLYWVTAGDPLLRFRLALAHGSVPSTELAAWVDTSRSPILNPQFIAGWKRPLGIELWWPIDPWLNLLANPQIGPWLMTGPLAAYLVRTESTPEEKRRLKRIGIGAVLLALAIVYGLAIDPKTRAFLLPLAAASVALGYAVARLWERDRRPFAGVLFTALLFLGLFALSQYDNIRPLEREALRYLQDHPGQIELDPQTRGTLALVPGALDSPLAPAGKPLRLTIQTISCEHALAKPIAAGRITLERGIAINDGSALCLVRYRGR